MEVEELGVNNNGSGGAGGGDVLEVNSNGSGGADSSEEPR